MRCFARQTVARTSVVVAMLASCWSAIEFPTLLAAPPPQSVVPGKSSIYDADPDHLWNRLHRAFWIRTGPDGKEYGHDRLDPYLWQETKHLLHGESHKQAITVLNEFLAEHGENLVKEPLKRAFLQRDLWSVFDWTTESRVKNHVAPSRALQSRLARIIQRLALMAEQIKELPDNYAVAVKSKAFAQTHDPDQPKLPFLPPDLLRKDGPWIEVLIDNNSAVTASRHVLDFSARSAFRVFLRLPEGRKATLEYMASLNNFPQPWLPGENPARGRELLRINPELPQFPAGTQVALVRQMLLIDKDGELAATEITESVQLRVFRKDDAQDPYEFALSRVSLFAGKSGGLRPLGREERDLRTQLLVSGYDEFELPDNDDFPKKMRATMQNCRGCHKGPGIFAIPSYMGGSYPRPQYHLPLLGAGYGDEQGRLSAQKKREQYTWGLLQGLWEEQPRR